MGALRFLIFWKKETGCGRGGRSRRDGKGKEMPNASIAIQVLPKNGGAEMLAVVDEVIAYLRGTGLKSAVGPFETVLEGDLDELMEIVKECQKLAVRAGSPGVLSYVKISYHPDGVLGIEEKTAKYRL